MDGLITDLVLAGYVPLRSQGIALPCYATGPLSNAWYCAVCSINGDHSGTVTAFEPFEASDIVRLPEASHRAVSLGDPWHDVLLWEGEAHVGTPSIIIDQLGDKVAHLATDAPLTLLDLAMASDQLDRAALVKTAHAHLCAQWGTDDADRWQTDSFARQYVLIEARKLLANSAQEAKADIIRELEFVREENTIWVLISDRLRKLLKLEGSAAAFEQRIAAFSADTGIVLDTKHRPTDAEGAANNDRLEIVERYPDSVDAERDFLASGRVLVATIGPRARQLVRYLRTPDWKPDWDDAQKYPESRYGAIDIFDGHMAVEKLEQYSVIIWVTDEVAERLRQTFPSELVRRIEAGEVLCILAPVLPTQAPPALLAERSLPTDLPSTTILDTSIVRSPFWSGNPKRSIDRRVADLISATAQLVADGTPIHAWLTADRPRYEPLLLSISTGQRSGRRDEILASEVSPAGLSGDDRQERDEKWFSWAEVPKDRSVLRMLRGSAVVRRHDPDFGPFAKAVILHRKDIPHFAPDHRLIGEVPSTISDCLCFPHLTNAFRARDQRNDTICVVSAEAPNLKALRAAAMTGWAIARYSDNEVLRYLVGGPRRRHPHHFRLPSDIALPSLNRLGRNRGLVVRGVDPRDVIRIRREIYDDWRQLNPGSSLIQTIRWYRADVNQFREPLKLSEYAAIPVKEFLRAEEEGDQSARYLRDHEGVETPSAGALAKRTADLRASWAKPTDGAWRLMLEDGKLPVRLGLVDDGEVAAQKFFTIDGDGSVPLLFTSRLFDIWARATLTRSPSWSSRFSITRTFETFPIPDDFLVISDDEGGRAHLRANPNSERLARLLEELDHQLLTSKRDFHGQESPFEDGSEWVRNEADRERVLLDLIGLEADASDLTVLERMVEMNRTAGV